MVKLQLGNVSQIKTSFIERIDDNHANALRVKIEMGKPEGLTPIQVSILEIASSLVMKPFEIKHEKDLMLLAVIMPTQGIAYITIELE